MSVQVSTACEVWGHSKQGDTFSVSRSRVSGNGRLRMERAVGILHEEEQLQEVATVAKV